MVESDIKVVETVRIDDAVRVVGSDRFIEPLHETDYQLVKTLKTVALAYHENYGIDIKHIAVTLSDLVELSINIKFEDKTDPGKVTMEQIIELIALMEMDPLVKSEYLNIRFNEYHKAPDSLKNLWSAISRMKKNQSKEYWKMYALLPKHGFATMSYDLDGELPVHTIMTRKGPLEYTS